MTDSLVKRVIEKVDKRIRMCFITAIICGLMAHVFVLTNHLYNYDELWHIPTGFGTGVQEGRWGLSCLAWLTKVLFDDVYTISMINGLITIIMYAILACLVVYIFGISQCSYSCFIGALITVFPSVVCRMFYMYTSHYYAIAEVIAASAVFVFVKWEKKILPYIISILMLAFATSIYQATFVTATCIIVGKLLNDLLINNYKLKDLISKVINYIVFLFASIVSYIFLNKAALSITGMELGNFGEDYGTIGQISVDQLLVAIERCYKNFLKAGFKDVYAMNPNIIVRLAFLLCTAAIVYVCFRMILYKNSVFQKIIFILVVLVLPIAVNLVYLMAATTGLIYSIMTFDMVFMLIIPISMLDTISIAPATDKISDEKMRNYIIGIDLTMNGVLVITLILTVWSYIWFANGNYLAIKYTNEHDNAYYQTLMTQIKSVEGYNADMPVATIGVPVADSTYTRQDMIGKTFNLGGKAGTNISVYSSWNIMTRILGYDPTLRNSDEEEEYFRGLDEVKDMPCYPSTGSIKIIDDTVVIKFQEPSELN